MDTAALFYKKHLTILLRDALHVRYTIYLLESAEKETLIAIAIAIVGKARQDRDITRTYV